MIGRLVIRADADGAMGTGHVMRCLALAEEWRDRGGEVLFAGRIEPEPLRRRIESEGAVLLDLAGGYPDPADLAAMRRLAGEQLSPHVSSGWMVLDGYHFDGVYQQGLREAGWQLLVIDDLGQLADYHCDALLNQNLYAPNIPYNCPPEATRLLGPRYALLRREFRRSGEERLFPVVAKRVLVTMGGADQHNVSARVLSALATSDIDGLEVKVVVGAANPHAGILAGLTASLPFRCELARDVIDMAALMRWADVVVTAAGTTTYELASVGVPFVTLVTADNQKENASQLARQRVAMTLGWHDALGPDALASRLREFLHDGGQRQAQAVTGCRLVDGRGAGRVVTALLAKGMTLHPAGWQDKDVLLQWANDPKTRKNSFRPEAISPEGHEQWLAAKLTAPDCRLWLAALSNTAKLGLVRFDLGEGMAEISVNLAPGLRGQGLGSVLIRTACARLFREEQGVGRIIALVKKENYASLRSFTKAGFVAEAETERCGIPAVSLRLERNQHD
ncbi:MAG: UDP-2,4-diacetamido-2,4,6-trideoxy-beta-L-altropyranose hydrolase [Desulfobulbaceae bacterium]|nr:UDP-2,4-diacetamido-2,4,6-trideoxy-beta-L-altropyranose hydrolase [Desulfobulbaceae bacterium]HIJ90250.1 UDP-2,4-diacetamido-2,4,6-trideoxy-beta-L-altropyranose hydrolase [Deltaproteobacteria bacterium]